VIENYWDSCAVIPLCFDDDAFAEHARAIAKNNAKIVTWWGTPVECCSAFARLRRGNIITPDEEQQCRGRLNQLSSLWDEVEPSEKLRQLARQLLLRQDLSGADALQLAAAIIWADGDLEVRGFVGFDKKLRIASQSEGFIVMPCQSDFEKLIAKQ
jgi:predicted nucleic acid-binding protein